MFSKLFRREYMVDDEYMPIFLEAFEALKAYSTYDFRSDATDILATQEVTTPEQLLSALTHRETPLRSMAEARARLQAIKPKDPRFSTNIHRRMIYLLEWRERELLSVLSMLTFEPGDRSTASAYARASHASQLTSERADQYAAKVIKDLAYIYEHFPDAKPYLAPIFEDTTR